MKRILTVLALCMGLIGATAGPAAATHDTPTKPGANRSTSTFIECSVGDDFGVYCFEVTFTFKVVSNQNGLYLLQDRYVYSETITENGVVTTLSTASGSSMFLAREGVETIYKDNLQGSSGDCEFSLKFLIVKGEIKIGDYNSTCS